MGKLRERHNRRRRKGSMLDSDLASIRKIPLFVGLDASVIEEMLGRGFAQTEPKGARIFTQGEDARFLHVVLQGRLALVGRAADARDAVVEFFGPGDVVLVPAVLLDEPYQVAAVLMEESRLVYLRAADVRAQGHGCAEFARNLSLMLAGHWGLLVTQIMEHKLKTAPQRLATYLLEGAREAGGRLMVDLAVDKRSLASRLGMTPENLSRNLGQLERLGVRIAGRHVEIDDAKRLRAFCHDNRSS